MPETIQIPRAWLEELLKLKEKSREVEYEKINLADLQTHLKLYAHIESAKSLLTERAKDTE